MLAALNWAYEHATAALPGIGSAEEIAQKHLRRTGGSREKAIDELINWQLGYAAAAGFISNVGGAITLPVAVPANLASVLLIQLRMIAAVAFLRGYKISDERVRTLAFLCLTGSGAAGILEEFSVNMGMKLSSHLIMQISRETLLRINRAVGFRLVGNAGSAGLINLAKFVPLVGGLVGGAFDAAVTRGIAAVAKDQFKAIYEDLAIVPDVSAISSE